jgi:putative SOS response-associated peptidase YedK
MHPARQHFGWTAFVSPAKLFLRIMCGRYSAAGTLDEFAKMIDFICRAPFFAPRYNIAPRQQAPVIVLEKGEPTLKLMRWGLIPGWAKDESNGDKLINARAETVSEKTSFKKPFEFQRCLVVADGFYEWQLSGRSRTPFRFTMKDKSFFCMAGLWERWVKPPVRGEFEFNDLDEPPQSRVIETFSIITTAANPMVAAVHERMPVILQDTHWQWWIDDRRNGEAVKFMLRPFEAGDMDCYRVSPLVNNARNDSPECLKPA